MADDMTDERVEKGDAQANLTLEAVYDIPVQLSVVLGKTNMQVNQLLKLGRGAVIELDRKVLADIAVRDATAFGRLAATAKAAAV